MAGIAIGADSIRSALGAAISIIFELTHRYGRLVIAMGRDSIPRDIPEESG